MIDFYSTEMILGICHSRLAAKPLHIAEIPLKHSRLITTTKSQKVPFIEPIAASQSIVVIESD